MDELAVQIVAPIGRDAELLSNYLRQSGISCFVASDTIRELTPEDRDASGSLLIAEEALTPPIIEHLSELLRTQPAWSDLPLLVLTPVGRETQAGIERQRQRLPLGHLTLLERPLRPASLLSAVQASLRARERQFEVRRATLERDRAYAAQRASEERNRLILQSTHDCIKLLELDGTLLSINEEGQRRLGIENSSSVCGTSWFTFWHGGDEAAARTACGRALAGEQGRFEAFYQLPSGEATWWDISVTPVRNDQQDIVNLLAVSREVTDRKLTEQALLQSEKLAAVGRLASSIAHEINNPLEAITNLLYLARQQAEEPDVQKYLDTADQELRRVSVIANQTLRFHKQASRPQAVRASELFETVLSIYGGRLKNSSIHVECRFLAEGPVRCFEGDVRQVLNNLVGNAVDAMSNGGRLLIRSHETCDWKLGRRGMTLTVADTGGGISPTALERIFEPFFTTKGISGTGLGLWVSREIVERHQGSLRVRSRQGDGRSGTVFRFFLPYTAGEC